MKKTFTLFMAACLYFCQTANSQQVVLNELYTDPGAGKSEFFELYNPSASATPVSLDNYTLLCFFDISGTLGWYVMDLPNLTVSSKGYFVGSAALPFNYQGVTNSIASDFNWNSAAFVANHGYVRKWVKGTTNLLDGNLYYDQASLPANFNDFLFRRTSAGASYSVFLYNNGILVNTFIGGTGGNNTIINDITSMPPLYIDMTASSPDFTIDFSGYGSLPVESTTANAGSDNGYIRVADGACASWVKSSAQINHTPKVTNGSIGGGSSGGVSVSSAISPGTPATGSTVNYDIVGAPSSAFPIEMQIYLDNGSVSGQLDATDTWVESNTENNISQGPFSTHFFPYNANILIVVKTSAGCLDQVKFLANAIVQAVNLVSFEGNRVNNNIWLNWKTETNEMIDRFEVENSVNGTDFTSAGIVFATGKTASETYTYTVSAPVSGKIVYRLKIVDKSGSVDYSNILVFQNKEDIKKPLAIINNPVSDRLTLSFQANTNQAADIKIVDMSGRLVQQQRANISKGTNLLSFPVRLTDNSGLYIVDLFDGTNHYTGKFVKQ